MSFSFLLLEKTFVMRIFQESSIDNKYGTLESGLARMEMRKSSRKQKRFFLKRKPNNSFPETVF